MFIIVPVLTGFVGGIIADCLGYNITDYQWWLVCLPWWLLSVAINMK